MGDHGLPTNFGGSAMAMSAVYTTGGDDDMMEEEDDTAMKGKGGKMPFHGNDRTMNMNPLILANVQGSPYFKNELFNLKTYHEVVDEIYYKVDHLEPWERGTRKTAGMSQTGMCGGVRGVSAGGVVSSAFCLLYKLHTLKLTRKQVYSLLNHCDSPYIRGLGFMYLRFTLPPQDMWNWFEPYLDDQEEIDIKAGGGKAMIMGEFCKLLLTKLEWFETRFPRIAVNHERQIRAKLDEKFSARRGARDPTSANRVTDKENDNAGRDARSRSGSRSRNDRKSSRSVSRGRDDRKSASRSRMEELKSISRRGSRSRSRSKKKKSRHSSRSTSRSKKSKKSRSRSRERKKDRKRSRDRSRERKRSRSKDRSSHKKHKKEKSKHKERSRDRDRSRRSRSRSRDRR